MTRPSTLNRFGAVDKGTDGGSVVTENRGRAGPYFLSISEEIQQAVDPCDEGSARLKTGIDVT